MLLSFYFGRRLAPFLRVQGGSFRENESLTRYRFVESIHRNIWDNIVSLICPQLDCRLDCPALVLKKLILGHSLLPRGSELGMLQCGLNIEGNIQFWFCSNFWIICFQHDKKPRLVVLNENSSKCKSFSNIQLPYPQNFKLFSFSKMGLTENCREPSTLLHKDGKVLQRKYGSFHSKKEVIWAWNCFDSTVWDVTNERMEILYFQN